MLPSLRDHRDEFLLRELLKRWNNHKVMVRWLSRFFNYLDRCARAAALPVAGAVLCLPSAARPFTDSCQDGIRQLPVLRLRYYIQRHSLPSLLDVGLMRFRGAAHSVVHSSHRCMFAPVPATLFVTLQAEAAG